MAQDSKIEWTDHTFNPWRGCVHVKGSRACAFCYAEKQAKRNPKTLGVWGTEEGGGTRVVGAADYWKQPLRWNVAAGANGERMRVFCASMADVFEDWRGPMLDTKGHVVEGLTLYDVRAQLWDLIVATPNLDWLLLTKRPANINQMVPESWMDGFPRNVWVGVTVEDQRWADERIPHLLNVPARVRFLSCEPLVGAVRLDQCAPYFLDGDTSNPGYVNAFNALCWHPQTAMLSPGITGSAAGIHWVIAGGESGPHAQPSHPDWFRSLRDQCQKAGVAFHFKQWGEWMPTAPRDARMPQHARGEGWPPRADLTVAQLDGGHGPLLARVGKKAAGRELDGRTWDELPGIRAPLAVEGASK